MFIYTIRASTLKFFGCIILCIAVLVLLLTLGSQETVYASADGREINYGGMKTNEDRVAFIEGFGIKVNPDPVAEESFTMPEDFDRVILGYNQIQKTQGLDLTKYKNKNVMRYTYELTNYDDYDGTVYATIIVYRERVIGGDVCSSDVTGFIHGFEK